MSCPLYHRFVGPATSINVHCNITPRVAVRTEEEAVSELGRQLACLVLTPQQLDLMQRDPPLVYLTGPPGTGMKASNPVIDFNLTHILSAVAIAFV